MFDEGILPSYTDSHQWIWEQRQLQFNDATHALDVMGYTNASTQPSEKLLLVWLLENRSLYLEPEQCKKPDNLKRLAIMDTVLKLFDREVDSYWLAKGFLLNSCKFVESHSKFKDLLKIKFEIEDATLYRFMTNLEAIDKLPLDQWFGQCFAGFIYEASLVRIWDKVVGGSAQIIIFLAIALLIHFRHSILQCKTSDEINRCIDKMTKETADIIVNEAIDLWQEHGGPIGLTISDPPKQK